MQIGVIIPSHGLSDKLERCLLALRVQKTRHEPFLVLIDNGTPDWSVLEALKKIYPDPDSYFYIRLPHNFPFARACNTGIHVCGRVDAFLFLNNDCYLDPDCVEQMAEALKEGKGDVIGALLRYSDNTIQHAGGVIIGNWEALHHIYRTLPIDHPLALKSRRTAFVTAACQMVRAIKFVKLEGFLECFENGFEDVDFCLRLQKAGGSVYYCAEATAVHEESQTPGRQDKEKINSAIFFQRWKREKVSQFQGE